ncbi:hypothetical protein PG996_010647 [Apiospora saccharicola]|uniref:Uncharacterized protein n=1 Tax=Apiospora saccharicola TaxID=335842 RepID=A0ABR1UP64_9PEZI
MLFRLFPKASKCSSTKPWKRVDSDGINVPSDCPSYFGADAGESDNDATRLPRKTRRIARKGNGDVASSKSEIKFLILHGSALYCAWVAGKAELASPSVAPSGCPAFKSRGSSSDPFLNDSSIGGEVDPQELGVKIINSCCSRCFTHEPKAEGDEEGLYQPQHLEYAPRQSPRTSWSPASGIAHGPKAPENYAEGGKLISASRGNRVVRSEISNSTMGSKNSQNSRGEVGRRGGARSARKPKREFHQATIIADRITTIHKNVRDTL